MSEADTIREDDRCPYCTPYRTTRAGAVHADDCITHRLTALERRAEQAEARVERWRGRAAGWQDRAEQAERSVDELQAELVMLAEESEQQMDRAEQAERALGQLRTMEVHEATARAEQAEAERDRNAIAYSACREAAVQHLWLEHGVAPGPAYLQTPPEVAVNEAAATPGEPEGSKP